MISFIYLHYLYYSYLQGEGYILVQIINGGFFLNNDKNEQLVKSNIEHSSRRHFVTDTAVAVATVCILNRVAPDIRQAGYPAFFISGIRPNIRFRLPYIRPEKLYMVYSFLKTQVCNKYKISKTVKVIEKMSTGCIFL